uniref:D-galacturonate reductase n=1 Tax=Candidatus Kentrum sp. TUN TaxID=2126343 RepID=A0A451A3J1_9GAMM|nr:MAG: D-galacturonate reductase [Candidatus Kentron sp. TUN]VFK56392.1 MAG: D-galacturonate reductase [Candidatus Kentron sp. TUN]VFK60600.1 MAG: D-galacturonate reductase [Candidatus Kentron sp. TUN]
MDVLIIGTGEYVTGFVGEGPSASDKAIGVVAICLFHLRTRGKVRRILLAGRDGTRFPGIRQHFATHIASVYRSLDVEMETWPGDHRYDETAYRQALASLESGSAVVVVTPDDTHFPIALEAITAGMHVLVAKPLVKTLAEHRILMETARTRGCLLMQEVHKRFDPIYADARDRACRLGDCSFMSSYMSQPKKQLKTFRTWAGRASDISYYLNAHHIDLHAWIMQGRGRPLAVTAMGADGVAKDTLGIATEDTITLSVLWENLPSRNRGVGSYTASWIAPESDVHSQQRFFYLGHRGELQVDQAHRGYSVAMDKAIDGTANGVGLRSINPLFMKYEPSNGEFAGQYGYGYRSIEAFIDAACAITEGKATPEDFDTTLPTAAGALQGTAILEAGRKSLDNGNLPVVLVYESEQSPDPIGMEIKTP